MDLFLSRGIQNLKSSRFLRRFFIIVFVCLGLSVFFIVFLLIRDLIALDNQPSAEVARIYQTAPTPGSDLQALEADAAISIPANAREIHGMISGFQDLDTWVRLDLPNADLPSFIQNARCTEPLKTTDPKKYTPVDFDPDWWQPHKATYLEECSGLHDYLSQRILVDRSKPEMLTIYVFSITHNYTKITTLTPKP
jgi:hypothetical protein